MSIYPSVFRIFILFIALSLSACASYDVVHATGGAQQALESQSLQVRWQAGNQNNRVMKQQKGTGVQKPTITEDETKNAARIANRIRFDLAVNLPAMVARNVDTYISKHNPAKSELVMEIGRVQISTEGDKDIVLIVFLRALNDPKIIWSRSIQITTTHLSQNDEFPKKFSDAILAQMKSSGLIQDK
ncbi:hypothetical protein [Undibacterium sp.]|uniref:hypothetical protein n=1 Tax=Undibacterium sp. TaxID=1914977 RepID=UPI0025D5C264|nr:hypothetical protein [Undibacterium sp.]